MRKLLMAVAGALVISIAVAGVASAVNTYEVHLAKSTSGGKGSEARPSPGSLRFGYRVGDTEGLRPHVVRQYRIAAEGLQSFPDARPACRFDQVDGLAVDRACRKALIGGGTINNEAGSPENPATPESERANKLPCRVKLSLYNISTGDPRDPKTVRQVRRRGGMAIRIDGDPPTCPIPVHDALAAPFYDVRLGGVSTAELRFTVPDTLAHPAGLDNSVREVTSTVRRKTGRVRIRGKMRTVGFYSSVGRKGRTRTVRVTFIDESGASHTATRQAR
jgi:hypothetical protein